MEERRLAKLKEEQEAEKRRYPEEPARLTTEAEKEVFLALSTTVKSYIKDAQCFIVAVPGTPQLLEIATGIAALKTALSTQKESAVKTALTALQATLSKDKVFSKFIMGRDKKRQENLAKERRLAMEKRQREFWIPGADTRQS